MKGSKKRMRDGKPKGTVKEAPKKPTGAMAKGKDDGGKKMMTEKEALAAVSEYMVKVILNSNIYSKTDLILFRMSWITCMVGLRSLYARRFLQHLLIKGS